MPKGSQYGAVTPAGADHVIGIQTGETKRFLVADLLGGGTVVNPKYDVATKDTGGVLTTADFNKIYTVNSASARIITLPSVAAGDIGAWVGVVKLGAGKVTIQAVDADTIAESIAAGSVWNEQAAELHSFIKIFLATETKYIIETAYGTWDIETS